MPKFIDIGQGHSLYEFMQNYWLTEPNANNRANNRALHRHCSLMRKLKTQTAIVENIPSNHLLIDQEKKALDTYFGRTLHKFKAFRITFSDIKINRSAHLAGNNFKESILSSLLIINFYIPKNIKVPGVSHIKGGKWHSYIYIAMVAAPFTKRIANKRSFLLNNYLHIARDVSCEIQISKNKTVSYSFLGSYFFQKSTYTSVCAQAALCMTINNASLNGASLVTPEEININSVPKIDHINRKFWADNKAACAGISKEDIEALLNKYGLNYVVMDFFENPNRDYVEFIYPYMESGCPTMLVFNAGSALHIVPILGHTLNTDMWRPEAELSYNPNLQSSNGIRRRSTSSWIDHFIIHDDNLGEYTCLAVDSLRRNTIPIRDPFFRASFAFAILPLKLEISAHQAEQAAVLLTKNIVQNMKILNYQLSYWIKKIYMSISNDWLSPIVTRTVLVNRDDYIAYLTNQKAFDGSRYSTPEIEDLSSTLPGTFWLTEISLPDLYTANRTKIADVFTKCDTPHIDSNPFGNILQVRLSEWLFKFNPDSAIQLRLNNHFPLFCRNGLCHPEEWPAS